MRTVCRAMSSTRRTSKASNGLSDEFHSAASRAAASASSYDSGGASTSGRGRGVRASTSWNIMGGARREGGGDRQPHRPHSLIASEGGSLALFLPRAANFAEIAGARGVLLGELVPCIPAVVASPSNGPRPRPPPPRPSPRGCPMARVASPDGLDRPRHDLPRRRRPTLGWPAIGTPPGWKVAIAATEPMVVNPVTMTFGDDGRLYVVEWTGRAAGRTTTSRC